MFVNQLDDFGERLFRQALFFFFFTHLVCVRERKGEEETEPWVNS